VEVTASIRDFCAQVEICQTFVNHKNVTIEAIYKFPLDEMAAVCGFTAEIGNKKIVAECMQKQKAKEVYVAAIASGQGGYLLEQKKADVFEMSVGNLTPGLEVKIRITYVAQLEQEDGVVRFVIPTTVAPRYTDPTFSVRQKKRGKKETSKICAIRIKDECQHHGGECTAVCQITESWKKIEN